MTSLSFGKIVNKPFTLVLIDFDDTLLPTTYLVELEYFNLINNPNWKEQVSELKEVRDFLKPLQSKVLKFLELAKKYGHVCLVTNGSTHDYIPLAVEIFFPSLIKTFQKNITIISAIQNWEDLTVRPKKIGIPHLHTKTKYLVFSDLVHQTMEKNYNQILSKLTQQKSNSPPKNRKRKREMVKDQD